MNENKDNKRDLSSVSDEVFVRRGDPIPQVKEEDAERWRDAAGSRNISQPRNSSSDQARRTPVSGQRMPTNAQGPVDKGQRVISNGGAPSRTSRNQGGRPMAASGNQNNAAPQIQTKAKNIVSGFFCGIAKAVRSQKGDRPYKEHAYFELARKFAVIGFSVLALAALIICSVVGYSYSGDSIRVVSQMTESERSSARAYRIVYSEADPFGYAAAVTLQELFARKTGATLKIAPDSEPVSRHEIRIGYTNRATDDYLTSVATLGTDGYAILLSSGDNVSIAAFSEAGANAAVKYFVDSYVGSYRSGELTFSNRMNLSVVSRSGEEPDLSLRESKITLNFTETGKFRVMVFSDADINTNTIAAIEAIAENEKPQMVLFAGDVSSGMTTKAELEQYITTLTKPLEDREIPWAVIFGEQDTDGGLSAEAQMEVYAAFDHCIAKNDLVSNGTVSYFLPVFAAGEGDSGSAPVFGVWAMGQTSMLSAVSNGFASDAVLENYRVQGTDYGYVTSEQIAWFTESSDILDREGGGKLPTIMVTHTPTAEFATVAENPDATRLYGNVGEGVAASPVNSGLFSALVDSGSVLGLYCGHDHLNSFAGRYCGIELGYCASIGYDGYGFGGTFDINNSLRGGRMIELTLKDGSVSLISRMVFAADYGIGIN